MLKCNWEGGTPTVVQIAFPEGDSFSARLQQSARLAKQRARRPESRAALRELFGDEFDLGELILG